MRAGSIYSPQQRLKNRISNQLDEVWFASVNPANPPHAVFGEVPHAIVVERINGCNGPALRVTRDGTGTTHTDRFKLADTIYEAVKHTAK